MSDGCLEQGSVVLAQTEKDYPCFLPLGSSIIRTRKVAQEPAKELLP